MIVCGSIIAVKNNKLKASCKTRFFKAGVSYCYGLTVNCHGLTVALRNVFTNTECSSFRNVDEANFCRDLEQILEKEPPKKVCMNIMSFSKKTFYDARQICPNKGKESKDNYAAFILLLYYLYIFNFIPDFTYEYRISLPNFPECFCVSTGCRLKIPHFSWFLFILYWVHPNLGRRENR